MLFLPFYLAAFFISALRAPIQHGRELYRVYLVFLIESRSLRTVKLLLQ